MKMHCNLLPAFALVAAAGTICPAAHGADPVPPNPSSRTSLSSPRERDYSYANRSFASADKLRGSSVKNAAGDTVGSVDELIIDRGSGAVTNVVLDAGGFLGIGTKSVVVPFSSFGWDAANLRLTLESTKDQVKAWPEYKKENWNTAETGLAHRLSRDYHRSPSGYYPAQVTQENSRIKGKVTKIDRRAIPNSNGEELVVTVESDDNRTQEVVIGPTWYMSGNDVALYRDAPIDISTARIERDGKEVLIARSLSVNSRAIPMYNDAGAPHWDSSASGNSRIHMGSPFMLSKELDGKKVEARGEKCGKIDDLLVECNSGRVAFISIDPDQNVLGIGDTKRLIPWDVAMIVTSERVLIDASKPMITTAPETPSDLRTLPTAEAYRSIYQGFGINEPYYYKNDSNRPESRPSIPPDSRDRAPGRREEPAPK